MLIHLVLDTSGSMGEWGKLLIARGVARAMEQYLRLGYGSADLKLVAWSNEARVVDWRSDQEFPPEVLVSGGAANAKALVSYFGLEPSVLSCLMFRIADEPAVRRGSPGNQQGGTDA